MSDGPNDDRLPGDDRIGADAVLEIVRVGAEYVIAGAIGGVVAEPANRTYRKLVSRIRRSDPSARRLTPPEALEWAVWLVESRYLPTISARVRTPTYKVNRWRTSSDGHRWAVELEYLRAGVFDVEFGDGERGPIGDVSVTWRPPSGALVFPSGDDQPGTDSVVSRRVYGLRAWVVFGLHGRWLDRIGRWFRRR
jgi:hypothetical protein